VTQTDRHVTDSWTLPDSAADGDFVELNGAVRTAGHDVGASGQSTTDPIITVTIAGQQLLRKCF